ncbi:MAG: hypothetical protein MJZ37_02505 [Bacilli bacterium]|nr:hypothetical protein [Bacilli bacterium]
MKKKIHLAFLLSLSVAGTMGLVSCGLKTIEEHDHIWDEGIVKTEATCHSEGLKIYSCSVDGCKQTKTESIARTEHSWSTPNITKESKCNEKGKALIECENEGCTASQEIDLEKSDHHFANPVVTKEPDLLVKGEKTLTCSDCNTTKKEALEAEASIAKQFSTNNKGRWDYGYVSSFDVNNPISFHQITAGTNETYSDDNVSIGRDSIKSNGNAAIAYHFTQSNVTATEVKATVSFKGKSNTSVLDATLILVDANGNTKTKSNALNATNKNEWNVTSNAIEVTEGDTLYLVFENKGTGEATGTYTYSLKAECIHSFNEGRVTTEPTEVTEGILTRTCIKCGHTKIETVPTLPVTVEREFGQGANFHDDFSTTEYKGWSYGYTNDYNFENDKFTFNPLSAGSEAWVGNGIEVKNDWFKYDPDGMLVVGYNVPNGVDKLNYALNMWGGEEPDPRWTVRIIVQDSTGANKDVKFIGKGQTNRDWDETLTLDVAKNDNIYLLLENFSGWKQGSFNINLTKYVKEFTGANFHDDFGGEGWRYGYTENYNFENNTFTLNPLNKDGEAYKGTGIEVKNNWFCCDPEGTMLVIDYQIGSGVSKVNYALNMWGEEEPDPRWTVRVVTTSKDGANKDFKFINKGETNRDWNETFELDVAQEDHIYLLLDNFSGWTQGSFNISITKVEETIPEYPLANFHDDFGGEAWSYGYTQDYNFDSNTFTLNPLNKDGEAYKGTDIEVKNDWFKCDPEGTMVVIGYKVSAGVSKINYALNMWGGDEPDPRWTVRIVVQDSTGENKRTEFIGKGQENRDWDETLTLDVAENDTVYLLLDYFSGWRQGSFNINITKVGGTAPVYPVANFHDDFGGEAWSYGYTQDYNFDSNTFTLNPLNKDGEAYKGTDIEVKNDWFKCDPEGTMVVIGYKVSAGVSKINYALNMWGGDEPDPRWTVRIVVQDSTGENKRTEFIGKGQENRDWDETLTLDVAENDTVYLLLDYFSGWRQGSFNINITK